MITEQIITLRKQLKSKLEPMRFEHSVSVSFTCTALAMRYGYDIQKAHARLCKALYRQRADP